MNPEDIQFEDLSLFNQHIKLMTDLIIGRHNKTLDETEQNILIDKMDQIYNELTVQEKGRLTITLLGLRQQYPKAFL